LTPAQVGFLQRTLPGFAPQTWTATDVGQAGSDRRFVRLGPPHDATAQPCILVLWDSHDPDWPRFLGIARETEVAVPFLPRVYGHDEAHGLVLEEDVGDVTLHAFCAGQSADDEAIDRAYERVIDALAQWQVIDPDLSPSMRARCMDEAMFMWESGYFALHCVTEYFGREAVLDDAWQKERGRLAQETAALPRVCMHRDFQSENILLQGGAVRFVDFQGARLGPAGYDPASLLFDPYIASLTVSRRAKLYEYYVSSVLGEHDRRGFVCCAVQRLMQALGAYGNLSLHKGKDWYRQYVPVALERLCEVAEAGEFRAVQRVARACLGAAGQRGSG
jgi:aminoglycoside/choline kinase family phosphotransferase